MDNSDIPSSTDKDQPSQNGARPNVEVLPSNSPVKRSVSDASSQEKPVVNLNPKTSPIKKNESESSFGGTSLRSVDEVFVENNNLNVLLETESHAAEHIQETLNSKVNTGRSKSIEELLKIQQEWQKQKMKNKEVKKYYARQDTFIASILEAEENITKSKADADDVEFESNRVVNFAAKLSFFANILLMIAKLAACILSGSMAVLSSLVDSVVDLVSGAVIYYTSRAAQRANYFSYPFGRTRLEPAAIIIISVVMGLASFQIIIESIKQLIEGSASPNMDWLSIIMVFLTIIVKLLLFLFCRRIDSPSTKTLALDHRNDVVGNSFALICGWVGSQYKFLVTVDPIGAICISLYISYNWWKTGSDQMKVITGKTAPPTTLAKITWVALHHHPKIINIDTVRAFHLGSGFLIDLHVTLDESMSLKEAHDIGETLQNKLELLTDVEVAFVHLDYENLHSASSEHAFLLRNSATNRSHKSLSGSQV